MSSETPSPIGPELPWCVLAPLHYRGALPVGPERWCKVRVHGAPALDLLETRTACGIVVNPAAPLKRCAPTCLEDGCARSREETRARLQHVGAQLRDGAKRIGEAADRLNESIERCERSLRVGKFETRASITLDTGLLWWGHAVTDTWRLLYAESGRSPCPLTNAPMTVRIEAAHKLELLLDALLEAEEE